MISENSVYNSISPLKPNVEAVVHAHGLLFKSPVSLKFILPSPPPTSTLTPPPNTTTFKKMPSASEIKAQLANARVECQREEEKIMRELEEVEKREEEEKQLAAEAKRAAAEAEK